MLNSAKHLRGMKLRATDGDVGTVRDLYFDDERWTVRYLVVATGGWLSGREVLISPSSVDAVAADVAARLTRKQVEAAPGVETDLPVSRRYEAAHAAYFGYPHYWIGPYLWGPTTLPYPGTPGGTPAPKTPSAASAQAGGADRETHLRSVAEVASYRIAATDGAIGHVSDFLIDPQSWAIAQMVVDTRNFLPGKHVLVPTDAIDRVDWLDYAVHLHATREEVRRMPAYAG